MRPWLKILGICFGFTFVAGAIGAFGSLQAREFYAPLHQPAWAPPGWLFGPVWTSLYTLMAIAASLVWRAKGFSEARRPLILFFVQLLFNAVWSWIFFDWRSGFFAFADILLLWVLVCATLVGFWRVKRIAALLLVPYLAWISFAAFLCYTVWQLNPGRL